MLVVSDVSKSENTGMVHDQICFKLSYKWSKLRISSHLFFFGSWGLQAQKFPSYYCYIPWVGSSVEFLLSLYSTPLCLRFSWDGNEYSRPEWALFLAVAKICLAKTGAAAETVGDLCQLRGEGQKQSQPTFWWAAWHTRVASIPLADNFLTTVQKSCFVPYKNVHCTMDTPLKKDSTSTPDTWWYTSELWQYQRYLIE
jgi:hypothetical protein